MAIHYELQYQELLRKSVDAVAETRIALRSAELDESELRVKLLEASKQTVSAKQHFDQARAILDARIEISPAEAVEMYKKDTGKYPI